SLLILFRAEMIRSACSPLRRNCCIVSSEYLFSDLSPEWYLPLSDWVWTKVFVRKSWPKAAKVSKVVVPVPKPLDLLPLGRMTLPCKLKIDPERRRENIVRFRPSVVSPMPPYHVWL